MNCACGHSVFDHAKAYIVTDAEPWRGEGSMFFHSIQGHTFTLSGSCQAFRKGESYRDCGCQRFHKMTEEERFIKASQSWGGTQSLRDFVESLPKGEYLLRHTRSTYPDLAWYRQFDRPQSAGRPEVM